MSDSKAAGFPFISIIGTALVLGKLFEVQPVASWSWLWVTSPFWISAIIWIVVLLIVFTAYMLKK